MVQRRVEAEPIGRSRFRRISLELLHQWPGIIWLRLEPRDDGPVLMIQVDPGDIAAISALGDKVQE